MPFLVALLVIALIIAFLFLSTLFIVPQQQAYIIERFGKFNKVQFAGIHIRIPFVDRIAMKTNMRVNQLNVQLETKTLDNVFVTVVASTQFRVNPENVATAYYELRDPAGQLRSYMEDALRSAIPALSLDDAFARKDDVAFDVQKTVGNEMSRFGFTVVKTLITAIDPSPQVKNAMDSINAAQREKEATRQRAEAQRIQIETQAAAEAEKTRLQGEGQANYRREIANGIVDQIKSLQAVGMNIGDVNNVVLFNQYLDVLRSLSESNNSKTVVLPASTPGGYQDMYSQITQAMVTANETAGPAARTVPTAVRTVAPIDAAYLTTCLVMPAVVGHTLIGRRHVNRRKAKTKKRIPSFVGEPRRCDGECGNDERRDSCCKCAVVPRHTSVIRKASLGRQARVTSFPGEGCVETFSSMRFHGTELVLQIHDFLFQPCDGHGLGDDEQVALIGRGFIGERLRLQHDLRIGLPPCDGAFDALAANDFRVKTCAGEDAGRPVAP